MPFIPMSFNNTFKTRVVVVGVITVVGSPGRTAADYAARAPIAGTWRRDGVFVVIAALMRRQQPLAIAEYDAVLLIRVRPACCNQVQSIDCFWRQLCHRDGALRLIGGRCGFPCEGAGNDIPKQADDYQGGRKHAVAEPLARHEPRFPLLDHEFDDHERCKGIANGPWNQCSSGQSEAPLSCPRTTGGRPGGFSTMNLSFGEQ